MGRLTVARRGFTLNTGFTGFSMKKQLGGLICCLAGFALSGEIAHAQDRLAECVAIEDDAARLACYDMVAGRAESLGTGPTRPAVATPVSPAVPAETANERNFGLPDVKRDDRQDEPSELTVPVADFTINRLGQVTVTLENGQVWRQKGTNRRFFLKKDASGLTATISKGAFGSFWLTVEPSNNGRVRAERVE